MRVVAEFTTEPFAGEGEPPLHATAALDAAQTVGVSCDFGPLGTRVEGDADEVVDALGAVIRAALANGATRVTLQVERATADEQVALATAEDQVERASAEE